MISPSQDVIDFHEAYKLKYGHDTELYNIMDSLEGYGTKLLRNMLGSEATSEVKVGYIQSVLSDRFLSGNMVGREAYDFIASFVEAGWVKVNTFKTKKARNKAIDKMYEDAEKAFKNNFSDLYNELLEIVETVKIRKDR